VNALEKLKSWWRGPTDPESLAEMAEAQHLSANRDTIRGSQGNVGKQGGGSLLAAPTPDVLDRKSADDRP
jgi:hypothetical protein